MEFAFPWPTTEGEWLGFVSAAFTVLLGLLFLFAPRIGFGLLGIPRVLGGPEGLVASRATIAGFQLGLGLSALLLAQPLLYLALGFSWAFAFFGRVISMLSDEGNRLRNWLWLAMEAILAAMPLALAFGFVG